MLDTLTANTVDEINTFPVTLNERWRVVDDPLQWILQYRAGNISHSDADKTRKAWQGRRFCRTRDALLRDIRENCEPIDLATIEEIVKFPDRHPG